MADPRAALYWLRQLDGDASLDAASAVQLRCASGGELPSAQGQAAIFSAPGWVACIERPGGIRAFALADHASGSLLLIRDRMGEVPLCYLADVNISAAAFAAEAIASRFPGLVRIDTGRIADALIDYLQWIDLEASFYRQIRRVPPGSWVCIRGADVSAGRYWTPKPVPDRSLRTDGDVAAALRAILTCAVRDRRGEAGGRTGSMLSGGLDSSSVVGVAACAADPSELRLPTLSVIRGVDHACAETAAARAASEMGGIAPIYLDVDAITTDHQATLLSQLWAGDEPFDVHSSLLRWVYLRAAQSEVAAVMDGIDADSLFLDADLIAKQLRQGKLLAAWANVAGGIRYWKTSEFAPWQFVLACRDAYRPPLGAIRRRLLGARRVASTTDLFAGHVRDYPIDPAFAERVNVQDRVTHYRQVGVELGAFDLRSPTTGIERYFRAASPFGVLPSHPFLDTRVVEFCLGLPSEQKIAGGWPKISLRRAMAGVLPDALRWRRGKEHLGFQLTRTLVDADPTPVHLRLRQHRELLTGIVAESALVHHCDASYHSELDLLQRIELCALGEWLHKRQHLL
ncbi:MAG: asparagine synthase-related protein [Pseudomarimonas sp.]